MRKPVCLFVAVFCLFSCVFVAANAANDWGFESPGSWKGGIIDKAVRRSGLSSLRLVTGQQSTSQFALERGNYHLNCFARGDKLSGDVFVEIRTRDARGRTLPVPQGTFGWKSVSGVLYVERKTTLEVRITNSGKGTAWLDDLSVARMPDPKGAKLDKDGPYFHFVALMTSGDSKSWKTDWKILLSHASVPHVAHFKGEHRVYYVNGLTHSLYVGHGKDPEKLKTEPVRIDGLECGDCVDPDAVLVDGKIRLYYLGNFTSGGNTIFSASSSDGVNFTKDKGERYRNNAGGFITDPDVVKVGDKWFMYVSKGEKNIGLESSDGLSFSRPFDAGVGAVSDTVAVDGGYRQFYHGKGSICSRLTRDGRTFIDEGTRIRPPAGFFIGDPNLARIGNTWHMYVKLALAKDIPGQPPGPGNPDYPPGMQPGEIFGKAPSESYLKANDDSDFKPARGGVAKGPGPAMYRLMTASSGDGMAFQRSNMIVCDQGAVPDMAVDNNGWIYLYYTAWTAGDNTNKTVAAISKDYGKSWTFRHLNLERLPGESDLVDPDIMITDDRVFRLFTTVNSGGNARTVYHESQDGISFRRIGVAFDPGADILDPSTIKIGNTWHIYGGGKTPSDNWHGTSKDGARFKLEGLVRVVKDGSPQMMANGFRDGDKYRFFGFGNDRKGGISSFHSEDGVQWTAEKGWRLEADPKTGLEFSPPPPHDPAIARLPDGTYLMVYVALIKR